MAVAAEQAFELGVGGGAADEEVHAAGLGEEAALDGDGVAELGADLALPGLLVAGEGADGEEATGVGLGGVAARFCDRGEDGVGGEVA